MSDEIGLGQVPFITDKDRPFALLDRPMVIPEGGCEIAGCRLSPPSPDQLPLIRKHLSAVVPGNFSGFRYEHKYIPDSAGGGNSVPLGESEFTYATIQLVGSRSRYHSLQEASNLCDIEFNISGVWIPNGLIGPSMPALSYLSDWRTLPSPHFVILPTHIDELNRVHDALPKMRSASTRFEHAIRLYESIKSISETSPFRLVGCFSLIELLLVDRGGPKMKQIKSKIPILCSRSSQVGYRRMPKAHWSKSEFWEDFYDCRSDVAHNGSSLYGQIAKYGLASLEDAIRELNEVNKFILGACIDDTAFVAGMKP